MNDRPDGRKIGTGVGSKKRQSTMVICSDTRAYDGHMPSCTGVGADFRGGMVQMSALLVRMGQGILSLLTLGWREVSAEVQHE